MPIQENSAAFSPIKSMGSHSDLRLISASCTRRRHGPLLLGMAIASFDSRTRRDLIIEQIWLEDDLSEAEYPFVLANAFTQLKRLAKGYSKDAAYNAGNAAEAQTRQRRDAGLSGQIKVRPYIQIGPIVVWLVNGEVVRDRYYVPFIEGGNHGRYKLIPVNEVWLEYTMHPDELPYILVHECSNGT